jgi:predicted nucleotidyltransferase
LLKIAAWPDRGHVNRKDATDLAFLMQVYLDAGNNERLYEEHADLLGDDFDYELAGARLLGRDIATITSPETRTQLLEILQVETGKQAQYRMIEAMQRAEPTVDFDRQLKLVESLYAGLKSATEQSR